MEAKVTGRLVVIPMKDAHGMGQSVRGGAGSGKWSSFSGSLKVRQ